MRSTDGACTTGSITPRPSALPRSCGGGCRQRRPDRPAGRCGVRSCALWTWPSLPGIAEAIDWVSALTVLGVERLDAQIVNQTWGSVLKNRDDLDLAFARGADWLVGERG